MSTINLSSSDEDIVMINKKRKRAKSIENYTKEEDEEAQIGKKVKSAEQINKALVPIETKHKKEIN